MEVLFATSNTNKVEEANKIAAEYGMSFQQVNIIYPEVRAESVSKVAGEGVRYVYEKLKRPVIVEDSGLFIDALNDFPGTYSAYVFKRIGCEGILKLLDGVEDRRARFKSAIGYCDKKGVKVYEGVVEGSIPCEMRGSKGFGYDPIFKPLDSEKTFAEDPAHKNRASHRRKATELLCQALSPR
ncbi:MAG: XTP/dITP diphosphatase [Candidatus Altiarchaeales archaeon]|nr:XTP/dITP diphosphatase [Candidatus Altiarchaeales archaeon]MBD3416629.1 XTP/dITP diphosphatase [Candidatus Altiarchaeales archaeon]